MKSLFRALVWGHKEASASGGCTLTFRCHPSSYHFSSVLCLFKNLPVLTSESGKVLLECRSSIPCSVLGPKWRHGVEWYPAQERYPSSKGKPGGTGACKGRGAACHPSEVSWWVTRPTQTAAGQVLEWLPGEARTKKWPAVMFICL